MPSSDEGQLASRLRALERAAPSAEPSMPPGLGPMRAHCLQHVPFEGLGSIEPWLTAAGFEITVTKLFESAVFPRPTEVDLLVVMGGPMSANDDRLLPWLVHEKMFIRRVIEADKPVLGVCLGAQLIAAAMGGRVHPNPEKEIGWLQVKGTSSTDARRAASTTDARAFVFPSRLEVFQWHGETFTLPVGARLLAYSEACHNQAFLLGESVMGLQFHLETTPASARALVENCRHELIAARFVQTEQQILSAPEERYAALNRAMNEVLGFLTRRRMGTGGRSEMWGYPSSGS